MKPLCGSGEGTGQPPPIITSVLCFQDGGVLPAGWAATRVCPVGARRACWRWDPEARLCAAPARPSRGRGAPPACSVLSHSSHLPVCGSVIILQEVPLAVLLGSTRWQPVVRVPFSENVVILPFTPEGCFCQMKNSRLTVIFFHCRGNSCWTLCF